MANCFSSLSLVSNELLEEARRSPTTSALMVAIMPMASLTTSSVSFVRW